MDLQRMVQYLTYCPYVDLITLSQYVGSSGKRTRQLLHRAEELGYVEAFRVAGEQNGSAQYWQPTTAGVDWAYACATLAELQDRLWSAHLEQRTARARVLLRRKAPVFSHLLREIMAVCSSLEAPRLLSGYAIPAPGRALPLDWVVTLQTPAGYRYFMFFSDSGAETDAGMVATLRWIAARWQRQERIAPIVLLPTVARATVWQMWAGTIFSDLAAMPGGIVVPPIGGGWFHWNGMLQTIEPSAVSMRRWNGAVSGWNDLIHTAPELRIPINWVTREMASPYRDQALRISHAPELPALMALPQGAWTLLLALYWLGQDTSETLTRVTGYTEATLAHYRAELRRHGCLADGKRPVRIAPETECWLRRMFPTITRHSERLAIHDRAVTQWGLWLRDQIPGSSWMLGTGEKAGDIHTGQRRGFSGAVGASVYPDAIGAEVDGARVYRWWLEYDRGTESDRHWEMKLERYDRFLRANPRLPYASITLLILAPYDRAAKIGEIVMRTWPHLHTITVVMGVYRAGESTPAIYSAQALRYRATERLRLESWLATLPRP